MTHVPDIDPDGADAVTVDPDFDDAEQYLRHTLLTWVARAIVDANTEDLLDGYISEAELQALVICEVQMLEERSTEWLKDHVLLTLPDDQFHVA